MDEYTATDGLDQQPPDTCARKVLGPWLLATVVLICGAIALAVYHAEDMRQARKSAPPMQLSPFQPRGGPGRQWAQSPAAGQQVAFIPPWHGQPNPDAVTGATPQPMSFNQAIELVSQSVVSVNTSGATRRSGSGIIVHREGYILTNCHVVEGAKGIVVTLVYDQAVKSYPGQVVSSRPEMDLALLKITSKRGRAFSPAPLGNSDGAYVGQGVVAIGNPFGLGQSASAGIISNPSRSVNAGERVLDGLIQTDAAINPGCSGGPLANANGEVIGVSTAIYSPVQGFTGVGFAVPINLAKAAFGHYIEVVRSPLAAAAAPPDKGTVRRADFPNVGASLQLTAARRRTPMGRCWVGVDVRAVNDIITKTFDVPFRYGVLVDRVFANSPAAKAGLRRGDVIYRINDRRVRDPEMAWSFLAGGASGDRVGITLFRQGRRKDLTLVLSPEPANVRALLSRTPQGLAAIETGIEEISWIGIDIQPLEAGEAMQEFGVDPNQTGVFVGEVEGIAAIEAGLAAGDVIKRVNNREVKDIEAFKDVILTVDPSEGVMLDIVRQKRPFYITIRASGQDVGAWQ